MVLVHVGKSGGTTVRDVARSLPDWPRLRLAHTRRPEARRDLRYIIVARGPISRTLSAFRWRYRLVVTEGSQSARFAGEHAVLTRYRTLNRLGEALYGADGTPKLAAHRDFRRIHHLREGIDFHLGDILHVCAPEQIVAVLMQESLGADMERVFGRPAAGWLKDNRSEGADTELSPLARRNLARFLVRDYEALTRLYAWGKIDKDGLITAF